MKSSDDSEQDSPGLIIGAVAVVAALLGAFLFFKNEEPAPSAPPSDSQATASSAEAEPPEAEPAQPVENAAPTPGVLPEPIRFIQRLAQNYDLVFASQLDAERFQITREKSAKYSRDVFILKLGETSEDGKFRLDDYEVKSGRNQLDVKVDTSELAITYQETGEEYVLTRQIPETIPTYYAQLKCETSNGPPWEDYVKEGDSFAVPWNPSQKFQLVEIGENAAHVEFADGDGTLRSAKIAKSP